MKTSPRLAAIKILCSWQETAKSIDLICERHIEKIDDQRDRHLAKAITYGCLRKKAALDWVIARFSKHPLTKLKPATLQGLRTGIFQLLFLERIPPSAAVNETIKSLKLLKQPRWLTGFANGVLRNVERQKEDILKDLSKQGGVQETALNHPEWLLARWQNRYGEKRTTEICENNNLAQHLSLRINIDKISAENYMQILTDKSIPFSPGHYLKEAVLLKENISVHDLPGYQEGLFSVQDEIAQLICHMFAPFASGRYLDGCAGLGGKTMTLAQLLSSDSSLAAVEPDQRRGKMLIENLQRFCPKTVDIFPENLENLENLTKNKKREFDAILIDAPCSGLGVTGRHPDIRWNRLPSDLPKFQKKQLRLLQTASCLLSPSGTIVYATCSIEPDENEDVINIFLEKNPSFSVLNATECLPAPASHLIDETGSLRSLPGNKNSDGFFATRLIKK